MNAFVSGGLLAAKFPDMVGTKLEGLRLLNPCPCLLAPKATGFVDRRALLVVVRNEGCSAAHARAGGMPRTRVGDGGWLEAVYVFTQQQH